MLTAGLNALAMVRFGAFRIVQGSGDGFGLVLIGLAAIGPAILALACPSRNDQAKGDEPAKS